MENSHEFHLSKKEQKAKKKLYVAMALGGSLIWIPSCLLTNFDNGWILLIFTIGFAFAAIGVAQYIDIGKQKLKLVINETDISEKEHPNPSDDWHISYYNIEKITYQENKPSINIILKQPTTFNRSSIELYDYDNLNHIFNLLKDNIEKRKKKEQARLEELAKKEFIRQQQEKQYFQRINRLEDIQKIDPIQFEKLVSSLFKKMGYDVLLTKASGDEGIDIVLSKNGKKSIVQCKRYSGTVGQPVARDLYGSMIHNRAEDAYLITTGVFSLPTQTWASGKPIHLVDGKMLVEWIETILGKDGMG